MTVKIDAPPVRSLTENEKKVYKLLREGKTPAEIAKLMRIPFRENFLSVSAHPLTYSGNIHADTVMGLITSIREKGWNIDVKEEEKELGKRITPEVRAEIVRLRGEGKSIGDIVRVTGVSLTSAQNICHEAEAKAQAEADIAAEAVPEQEAPAETAGEDKLPAESVIIDGEVAEAVVRRIDELNDESAEMQGCIEQMKYRIREYTGKIEENERKRRSLESWLLQAGFGDVLRLPK